MAILVFLVPVSAFESASIGRTQGGSKRRDHEQLALRSYLL